MWSSHLLPPFAAVFHSFTVRFLRFSLFASVSGEMFCAASVPHNMSPITAAESFAVFVEIISVVNN